MAVLRPGSATTRRHDGAGRARARRTLVGAAAAVLAAGCANTPLALHVPQMPPAAARAPTPVDVEPIAKAAEDHVVVHGRRVVASGQPELVLTDGMRTELAARALHGGERGGYTVRCSLDRFAIRDAKDDGAATMIAYADLACTAARKADGARVWRGELFGRSIAASKTSVFSSDDEMWQRLADRVMSDVSRELASDLAVGVLRLTTSPSGRSFAGEDAERALEGVDDVAPYGAWALAEDLDAAKRVFDSGDLKHPDPRVRAAAWNVVAMAEQPGTPWVAGIETVPDDDVYVRFFQYKALARYASKASLVELKIAVKREGQSLLEELGKDALALGGIGVRRAATAATSGTTTSP